MASLPETWADAVAFRTAFLWHFSHLQGSHRLGPSRRSAIAAGRRLVTLERRPAHVLPRSIWMRSAFVDHSGRRDDRDLPMRPACYWI